DCSRINQLSRRSILLQAEMKIAAGQQRCDGTRFCQREYVVFVDLLEVVATRRVQFDGELRRPCSRQLLRMQSWNQLVLQPCGQNLFGLCASKCSTVAKYVTKFSQTVRNHFGNQHSASNLTYSSAPLALPRNSDGTMCAPRNVEAISIGCSAPNSLC